MAINFLEKDLEDIIYEAGASKLQSRGMWAARPGYAIRQLNLNKYGIADIVTVSSSGRHITIDVYELKQDKINVGTLLQAAGYVRGIQTLIGESLREDRMTYRVFLVGRRLDTSGNFCYLSNVFDNLYLYTYNYSIDGIRFKNERGYELTTNEHTASTKKTLNSAAKYLASKMISSQLNTVDELPF